MQHGARHPEHDYADPAAFFLNEKGQAAIAFSDPAFVRADLIVIDRRDHSVHAVLHESSHLIGHVSPEMADAILGGGEILLAAVHTQGHLVDLFAPVSEISVKEVRQ